MANRTTVKSNIVTKNVPTVTNAILTDMLNTEMCDNLVFREDVAVTQVSSATIITLDFTGKDRIDLTRTGGGLNISLTGLSDGDRKFVLITKTAGQVINFFSVTDATKTANSRITAASSVLYEICRKAGANYVRAWFDYIQPADDTYPGVLRRGTVAEHNALASDTVICVPGRLPVASTTQVGLSRHGTNAETRAGLSTTISVTPAGFYDAKVVDRGDAASVDFSSFTKDASWHDLDLSAIVPAGAKMVFLRISASGSGGVMYFRKNGNTNTVNLTTIHITAASISFDSIAFCDSNRVIEYNIPATATVVNITIAGWI